MKCKTCVFSHWDYPSTECRECRGYSRHTTRLPLPGVCPGEKPVDDIDQLYMDMLKALDLITSLNKIFIYGDGVASTRAGNMLQMIKHELKTLQREDN